MLKFIIIFSILFSSSILFAQEKYIRIRMDIAILESEWNNLDSNKKNKIINDLLDIKIKAKKINEGKENVENTVSVVWHLCENEMPQEIRQPCPNDQDITTLIPEKKLK